MAFWLPFVMILSTMITAVTTYQSIKQQNRMNRYQQKIAENNAKAAEYEADYAKQQAAEEVREHRRKVALLLGSQRAQMGATGFTVDEGTSFDLTLDTAEQGKLDELAILHEGDVEAWRARMTAGNYATQAQMYSSAASQSPAAAALMTGAQKGLGYYTMYKMGQ